MRKGDRAGEEGREGKIEKHPWLLKKQRPDLIILLLKNIPTACICYNTVYILMIA